MEKNIKDYIHFYLGCDVTFHEKVWDLRKVGNRYALLVAGTEQVEIHIKNVVPRLRPLDSMTTAEMQELLFIGWPSIKEIVHTVNFHPNEIQRKLKHGTGIGYTMLNNAGAHFGDGTLSLSQFTPGQFSWLVKERFDVFELIPAGLAKNYLT